MSSSSISINLFCKIILKFSILWFWHFIFKHLDLIVGSKDDNWWEIKKIKVFVFGSSRIFKILFEELLLRSSALSIIIIFNKSLIKDDSFEKFFKFLIWSILIYDFNLFVFSSNSLDTYLTFGWVFFYNKLNCHYL